MSFISTSLTVRGQPSPWFHVEAWLPFGNCEMDYYMVPSSFRLQTKKYMSETIER